MIDNHIGNGIFSDIDYNTGSFIFIGFIVDMRDAINNFFYNQLSDSCCEHIPAYLVRYLVDYNLLTAIGFGINADFAPQYYPSPAGMHSGFHAFHTEDDSSAWKIRCFYVLNQLVYGNFTVVNVGNASINYF